LQAEGWQELAVEADTLPSGDPPEYGRGVSLAAHGSSPSSDGDLAPRAIRERLLPEDVGDFDREYRQAMADATESLDLNPVLALLRRWRLIAWSSQDPTAYRRMLAKAAAINAGEHPPAESWHDVKASLGL
jgi:Family of unknown function (DUF6247)